MHIAILGLGEVGKTLSRNLLENGVTVSGWDPAPINIPDGVIFAGDNPGAAKGADLILSTNLSSVAVEVASEVLPSLETHQVYADMNTTSPDVKREIDRLFQGSPARFADVAIMAPILPRGLQTPTLACGQGAESFAGILSEYGMPVTVLAEPAGQAATRKLLRSVFYKGVAAVVLEMTEAAEKLGLEAWARKQMGTILCDETMIDRFIEGSRKHAGRRIHEMEAVLLLLQEIGVEGYTSSASKQRLEDLLAGDTTHAIDG